MTRRIVEAFAPEKIILFGSYAYGQPEFHSDIDLLVVTNYYNVKLNTEVFHSWFEKSPKGRNGNSPAIDRGVKWRK